MWTCEGRYLATYYDLFSKLGELENLKIRRWLGYRDFPLA